MILVSAVPPREAFDGRGLVSGHPEAVAVLANGRKIVMDTGTCGEAEFDAHATIIGPIIGYAPVPEV
ncbi:hypothetical protein Aple_054600 [Acrocarpospora pleiomorpha]|uniref:Uncharacterized protein n=1 Tax=Acrocarpospora pleiomorpha TaxID=90975 RepID=A0A5M3XNM4_9ACTN|nr:hypothetical protein Aple_054600 [Acrocarpospora pleiomorpha]